MISWRQLLCRNAFIFSQYEHGRIQPGVNLSCFVISNILKFHSHAMLYQTNLPPYLSNKIAFISSFCFFRSQILFANRNILDDLCFSSTSNTCMELYNAQNNLLLTTVEQFFLSMSCNFCIRFRINVKSLRIVCLLFHNSFTHAFLGISLTL